MNAVVDGKRVPNFLIKKLEKTKKNNIKDENLSDIIKKKGYLYLPNIIDIFKLETFIILPFYNQI